MRQREEMDSAEGDESEAIRRVVQAMEKTEENTEKAEQYLADDTKHWRSPKTILQ